MARRLASGSMARGSFRRPRPLATVARVEASGSLRPLMSSGSCSLVPWLARTVSAARRTVSSVSPAREAIFESNAAEGAASRPLLNWRAAAWRPYWSLELSCCSSFVNSSAVNFVSGPSVGAGGAIALSRSAPSSNCQRSESPDLRLRFSVTMTDLQSNSTSLGIPAERSQTIRPSPAALTRGSEPVNMRLSRLSVFCSVTVAGVTSATLILIFCRTARAPWGRRAG